MSDQKPILEWDLYVGDGTVCYTAYTALGEVDIVHRKDDTLIEGVISKRTYYSVYYPSRPGKYHFDNLLSAQLSVELYLLAVARQLIEQLTLKEQ
jgi:hypothetical protein